MVNYVFLSVYFYSVPNLRFREFNEQLVYTSFGHVMKLYRGSSPRPIINYVTTDKSGLNWIKIGDMPSTGNRVFFCKERINKEGSKKSRAVYKGDIILSNSMSFGKPYILEIDGFIHDGWFVIRDYQNYIDKTYLCQLLSSDVVQKQYKSTAAGGVVKNISSDLVNSVKFHLPSIMEQRKIARFLELIDQKIEVQIKIINDLVLQKKCIISSLLKSVQDNEKIMLKDILFDYNIKTTINNEYPVLSSTASGMYLQSEYFNKEASSDNTIGYKIIPRGYCTYRSMSDTGLFTFNMQELVEKGIVSPAYPVFSANDDYINEFIILYLNNSSYIKKQILELKSGGTRFALPFSTLCTLKIPKLDKEKQLSLIKTITAFERKIENEEMILKALHQQKNFLLNNMFI